MRPLPPSPARLVGRVWRPDRQGSSVIALIGNRLVDISPRYPTMSDLIEDDAAVGFITQLALEAGPFEELGELENFLHPPQDMASASGKPCLLAPADLQAIKACGVTFAKSMIERIIDEKTAGDPARASLIRQRIGGLIGESLANVRAGSPEAARIKDILVAEDLWSAYLEVGIGPDAEVFTKSQPMSAVGYGAFVGIHSASRWNNPEPEIVLAVSSRGIIRGATLGNDVNLRDVEGRSALLLGKAKDNNASCAIGPFIRLFDDHFSLADIEAASLTLRVRGDDGFMLEGQSNMREISRSPADLVAQTIHAAHQYPDGLMLFLGTMFAPTQDRDGQGNGFTHKPGDVVEIATPLLGMLSNTVTTSEAAPPWTFGARALMRNLAARGLLG